MKKASKKVVPQTAADVVLNSWVGMSPDDTQERVLRTHNRLFRGTPANLFTPAELLFLGEVSTRSFNWAPGEVLVIQLLEFVVLKRKEIIKERADKLLSTLLGGP